MIRNIRMFFKQAVSRHPVAAGLCFSAGLMLMAIQVWDRYGTLPARDWISENLDQISVADPENFSFAVFGDNKNSNIPFERLLDAVDADPEITFALDLGDTVFDGEREKYRYFLEQVRDHLHKPLLTAIGNHEIKDNGRGLYAETFGPFYYAFRFGDTAFIILDNANEERLDAWQRTWLEKELQHAQNDNCRIFVFFHVPLFDPRGGSHKHCLHDTEAADDLQKLFKKYKVDHIFCSHIHGYFQGTWNSVPYTVTGGAGAELSGTDSDHYFYHYLKVNIHSNTVTVELCRMPSPDSEWFDRVGTVVWLYVSAFFRIHGVETALLLVTVYFGWILAAKKEKDIS